jgi:hypothetical protein
MKCPHCGAEFESENFKKVYCKRSCKERAKDKRRDKPRAARHKRTRRVCSNRNRDYIYADKIAKGCSRCLERRPNCLDYHHIDRKTKVAAVSRLTVHGVSLEKLITEIAKCVLLCANCHRVEELGDGYRIS